VQDSEQRVCAPPHRQDVRLSPGGVFAAREMYSSQSATALWNRAMVRGVEPPGVWCVSEQHDGRGLVGPCGTFGARSLPRGWNTGGARDCRRPGGSPGPTTRGFSVLIRMEARQRANHWDSVIASVARRTAAGGWPAGRAQRVIQAELAGSAAYGSPRPATLCSRLTATLLAMTVLSACLRICRTAAVQHRPPWRPHQGSGTRWWSQ
jgi:hypothetical protein